MVWAVQKLTLASQHQAGTGWAEGLLWLCAAAQTARLQWPEWSCQTPATLQSTEASHALELP